MYVKNVKIFEKILEIFKSHDPDLDFLSRGVRVHISIVNNGRIRFLLMPKVGSWSMQWMKSGLHLAKGRSRIYAKGWIRIHTTKKADPPLVGTIHFKCQYRPGLIYCLIAAELCRLINVSTAFNIFTAIFLREAAKKVPAQVARPLRPPQA